MRRALPIFALLTLPFFPSSGETQSTYIENVEFSVRISETSYGGQVNELFLMLDRYGGRNRLQDARRMTNTGGDRFSITVPMTEGDYIYVFCVNAAQYVDLSDPNLNPDDVPDSNFFNDPHPRFSGFGGQYSSDNLYFIRDPNRPKIDPTQSSPKSGTLITQSSTPLSIRVNKGADGRNIDPASIKIRLETNEVFGLTAGGLVPPQVVYSDVASPSFNADGSGGTIHANLVDPPEGVHILHLDVANTDGLTADTITYPLYINRQNQAPVADAGGSRYTVTGRWTEIDGGNSRDPDNIGFSNFSWRKVSGPGNVEIRTISQEPRNGDQSQRQGNGLPVVDGDGNIAGDLFPTQGAVPQMRFDQPGDYVVGLTITDREGLVSQESTASVHVSSGYDASIRLRLHAGRRDGKVIVSARASDLSDSTPIRFQADSETPVNLAPVNDSNGREVELVAPAPGTYFIHAQAGNQGGNTSYAATLVVRVETDGTVTDRDLLKSPAFWKDEAVLYLLFIREFVDSDGDGEGDLRGAIDNIPWMKRLGINSIWLMPVEPSGTTHGYSMDSFFAIHPDYGTLTELQEFIAKAHEAGIRVILDKVLNHTSARHPWFTAAQANADSVTRDRYFFRPDGSYQYTFNFVGLPDLNYNNPIVRSAAIDRAKFWMELGFDGFRCDVAGFTPFSLWRGVRREMLREDPDSYMVGEILPPLQDFIEEQFDGLYDPWVAGDMRDAFGGSRPFSSVDSSLRVAEHYVQDSGRAQLRERLDNAELVRMRYIDNQDEDRFLFIAGGSKERQKVAAAVQMTLPGVPLITYGDEVALIEQRGRMNFNRDPDMTRWYRKVVRIRNNNPGLRGQSSDLQGVIGNRYIRISSDGDLNANQIFSFLRHGNNQIFVTLANRNDATVLGTPVTYYVSNEILGRLPDGPIKMTNHAKPDDVLTVTKSQLLGGHTSHVGAFETKIYQLSTAAIPDRDGDQILDSYDSCVGVNNGDDYDDDYDKIANACDHCPASTSNEDVGLDGCARMSAAPKGDYLLDGKIDDNAFLISENQGLKLYASFNGKQLYVAMTGATAGQVHVIYFRDLSEGTVLSAAPFSRSGRAAARWSLIDEGRGDVSFWQGPWVGTRIAASGPLEEGVVESTINLVERYGDVLPEKIGLAAVRYSSEANGGLLAQAPAALTQNGDVESTEMIEFSLPVPEIRPAQMGGENDAGVIPGTDGGVIDPLEDEDSDGIANADDNCFGTRNPSQADGDGDGRGDACDSCPTTTPGTAIDGNGCSTAQVNPPGSAFDEDKDGVQKESCGCRTTPNHQDDAGVIGVLAMFALLALRKKSAWWIALLGLSACSNSFTGSDDPIGEGRRLVTGKMRTPDPAMFQKYPIALELVGASLDAQQPDPLQDFATGIPFSPSGNGDQPVTFRLALTTDRTYALFFQIPAEGTGGIGHLLAPLRFSKDSSGELTDVLSGRTGPSLSPMPSIDLGVIDITVASEPGSDKVCDETESCVRTYQVVVGEGESKNPLATNDTDGDGTPDLDDNNDDNDVTPDEGDEDANGDGTPDVAQTIDALADDDANGIPDRFN
jgi:glycosidase